MRKYGTALVFLLAASSPANPQKTDVDKFLPPAKSHEMTISGYGCDKLYVAGSTSTSKYLSYWTLTVWAEYGKESKKYWQKTYGNFEVAIKPAFHANSESAHSGRAMGAYGGEAYDFTPMNKACAEWGAHVKSALKIDLAWDKKGQKIIWY